VVTDFDLVIFDCDGVVADSELLSCRCLRDTLGRHGLTIALDCVFERFLGRSASEVATYYLQALGRPLPADFAADLRAHLTAAFQAALQPMPHVGDVLSHLDRPYCLASSSDMERIRLTLAVTGLAPYFADRVFNVAMVDRGKPEPDLYLFIAAEMGARPRRTLVIEDTVVGVAAGKAAGMTVWGFIGGSHYAGRDIAPRLIAAGADRVFHSMSELLPQ